MLLLLNFITGQYVKAAKTVTEFLVSSKHDNTSAADAGKALNVPMFQEIMT